MGSELIYSLIIVISLGIFFYFGNFRASNKQTDRPDRINWGKSIFEKLKKLGDYGKPF